MKLSRFSPDTLHAPSKCLTLHSGITALLYAACAQSAFAASPPWPEKFIDPKPGESEELKIPMPCGGGAIFMPVEVPSSEKGVLADRLVTLGSPDGEPEGYNLYQTRQRLSGPFTSPKSSGQRLYYLAKYPMTRNQYAILGEQAVKGVCPDPASITSAGQKPVTRISFLEAQAALQRWSVWLHKNAPNALPKRDGLPGFVRLPTDSEWEFAARGGSRVSATAYAQPFWRLENGKAPEDYMVTGAEDGMQKIGSKLPNPLGLYDMLGNVWEMVLDPYRLNHAGEPQGQSGGVQLRGGSYNDNIAPNLNSRQEMPLYNPATGEPNAQATTGFRAAIGADALGTSQSLPRQAENDFRILLASQSHKADQEADQGTLELKAQLEQQAKTSQEAKARLAALEARMRQEAREKQEAQLQVLDAELGSLISVRELIAARKHQIRDIERKYPIENIKRQLKKLRKENPEAVKGMKAVFSKVRANLKNRRSQLQSTQDIYQQLIQSIQHQTAKDPALLPRALEDTRTTLQQTGQNGLMDTLNKIQADLAQPQYGQPKAAPQSKEEKATAILLLLLLGGAWLYGSLTRCPWLQLLWLGRKVRAGFRKLKIF